MKKTKLLLGALLMVFAVVLNAQTPQLTFKFNNAQLIQSTTDSMQFDVQVKCDQEDTWMRDMQVYFEYNPDGFGYNVYNNSAIEHFLIGIMDDPLVPGNPFYPLYGIVNGHGVDNTSTRYAIITETYYPDKFGGEVFNFAGTDYPYNIEMPTTYIDFLRFRIAIDDPMNQAGIYFYEQIMNGGQFWTDTLDPAPVPYMDPNLYENDLMDFWLTPTGTVAGTVTDATNGNPVDGAEITINNAWTVFTAADGTYSIDVPVGTWDLMAMKAGYDDYTATGVVVNENQTTTLDFQMNPQTTGTLAGMVTDAQTGNPLQGAVIDVDGGAYTTTSLADGSYTIDVPGGTYDVTCSYTDYSPETVNGVVINISQTTTQDFALTPLPGSIKGTVTDATNGNPLENVMVEAVGPVTASVQTNAQGVYVIDNLDPGTYDVTATFSGYESLTVNGVVVAANQQTTGVDFALNPLPFDPPENVQATFMAPDDVHITWDPPAGQGTPAWIRWDNGTNDDAIGLTSGGTFLVGARFTPTEIGQYDGYYLTKIDFYPYAAGTFVLKVWTGANAGTEVHSQNLSGLNIGAWNEITLSSNVLVDGNDELWIGYEVTHAGGDYPAGVDAGPAVANYGDMISLDGTVWESMSIAYGLDYNWNIAGYVSPSKTADLAVPIVNNTTFENTGVPVAGNVPPGPNPTHNPSIDSKALTGYNVYRDGSVIASDIPDLEYWDNDLAPGTYEYCVTAVYDDAGGGESDQVCDDPVTIPDLAPPQNVMAGQTGPGEVTIDWDAPGGGGPVTILCVDRDGSYDSYTDCWPAIQTALDANGYTYDYHEVTDISGDGPDLATMMNYDVILWWSGEAWGYYGDDCMTATDESNLGQFMDAGGSFFFSGMDYLWASYPSAGNLNPGSFPHDYLGMTSVSQDAWTVTSPATAAGNGVAGSVADGLTFTFNDVFSTKDGLFIDEITGHNGTDMIEVNNPAPTGIAAIQYEGSGFRSIFTTVSFSAISDATTQADFMDAIITYLSNNKGSKDPDSYTVYRDGTMIADNITNTMYVDAPVNPGVYDYCVEAVYPEGTSVQVCDTAEVIQTSFDPPENVVATYDDGDVVITWDYDIPQPTWLHWDDGINADAIGLTGGGTFYVGARFTPTELGDYDGQYLTKVSFFNNEATATFVLKIWTGANAGTEVLSQPLSGLNAPDWNEIDLTNAVEIDASQELWIGYEVTHGDAVFPAGTDAGPAVANFGDMLSIDGTTWESMSIAYGLDYNWNIQGLVSPSADGEIAKPLNNSVTSFSNMGTPVLGNTPPSKNAKFEPKGWTHFNIYQDGAYLDMTTELMYTDPDVTPNEIYEYCVSAVYDNGESDLVCDTVLVNTGINELLDNTSIFPNPATNYIKIVTSVDIEELSLMNAVGQIVESRTELEDGNILLQVNKYNPGVYILQLRANDQVYNKRIVIR